MPQFLVISGKWCAPIIHNARRLPLLLAIPAVVRGIRQLGAIINAPNAINGGNASGKGVDDCMISDRDLIIGLYEAIGRLSHRLTGERIRIRIVDSATGKRYLTTTPTSHSSWVVESDKKEESNGTKWIPRSSRPKASVRGRGPHEVLRAS